MSEIEKMQRYIERTKMTYNTRYCLDMNGAVALANRAWSENDFPVAIINLAFEYGRAKGYRAAKAEARR